MDAKGRPASTDWILQNRAARIQQILDRVSWTLPRTPSPTRRNPMRTALELRGTALLATCLLLFSPACSPDPAAVDPATTGEADRSSAVEGSDSRSGGSAEDRAHAPAGYTCPMHPAFTSPRQVPCPECGMRLVPRSDGAFVCAQHFESVDIQAGDCSRCSEPLRPIPTRKLWHCKHHPELDLPEPGTCPVCEAELEAHRVGQAWVCPREFAAQLGIPEDAELGVRVIHLRGKGLGFETEDMRNADGSCSVCGRALLEVHLDLPHGDHEPRHGGVFFMAADNWHHVEGTVPEPGVFRLWVYDNFTRPLPSSEFRAELFRSRVDPDEGLVDDADGTPLQPSTEFNCLEAKIADFELPLYLFAKVDFDNEMPPQRFDFAYTALSVEPDPAGSRTEPGEKPGPATSPVEKAPETIEEHAAALQIASLRVQLAIRQAQYDKLYLPAFAAKRSALALEQLADAAKSEDLQVRERLHSAVEDTVRGAWRLDLHGDQGDRPGVLSAYRTFQSGVDELGRLVPLLPEAATKTAGEDAADRKKAPR